VEEAGLVLYNTCSIRDKAEQKVFNRLADYKKYRAQGKQFGVLGCVAQQEGEKIFERAPYVSLVCGSASYRNLPSMLVQLETGSSRVTGLDDRMTDACFETEYTARTNPHRGYITIIEGCDKFCAYCVVPYTRGKERSAGLPPLCLTKRGNWWTWAIRRFNCSGKTLTLIAIHLEIRRLPSCWRRWLRWREFGGCGLLLRILGILDAILSM
jgi:hypothetical protein